MQSIVAEECILTRKVPQENSNNMASGKKTISNDVTKNNFVEPEIWRLQFDAVRVKSSSQQPYVTSKAETNAGPMQCGNMR